VNEGRGVAESEESGILGILKLTCEDRDEQQGGGA